MLKSYNFIRSNCVSRKTNKQTSHRRDWNFLLRPQKPVQLPQGFVPASGTCVPPSSVKASAGQDASL